MCRWHWAACSPGVPCTRLLQVLTDFSPAMFVLRIKVSEGACNSQNHLFLCWQPALHLLFYFPKPLTIPFQTRRFDSIIQRKTLMLPFPTQRAASLASRREPWALCSQQPFPSSVASALRPMIIFSFFSVCCLFVLSTTVTHHHQLYLAQSRNGLPHVSKF